MRHIATLPMMRYMSSGAGPITGQGALTTPTRNGFKKPGADNYGFWEAPRRYDLAPPEETGAFVLPTLQSFFMDARMMPNTGRMIALLTGWAGVGNTVTTTLGVLGGKMNRCTQQIRRYLKDARRLGYLDYSFNRSRITGMITGLRITLCTALIKPPRREQAPKTPAKPGVTHKERSNKKHIYINTKQDRELDQRLKKFEKLMFNSE